MFESLVFHYCVFFRDNRMEYGWIEGIQKNKLIIVPLHGKKQFLAGNRIALSWKDDKLNLNAELAHESLLEQTKKAEQYQQSFELETIHSLLDEIKEYSLEELAVDFLNDAEDTICKLGLFLAMREDSFWFKHNRNLTYTPRTEEELSLLKVQLARQKELKDRELNIQTWIKNLESGDWHADSEISTEQKQWLHQLLNLLTEGTDSQHWKEMSSLLNWGSSFGIGEENALKRWLEKAGSSVSTSRLTLLRASVREHFSNEIYQEVERVRKIPLEKQVMLSPEVPTFTIDAKKTRDYDDAFSVMEWSSGGLVIAVHITDLSDFVYPQDALFKEAEARISSVYSLEESIPMIPDELSSDTFSLKAGEDRKVLSFMFQLSASGNWNLLEVVSRVIRVQKNLSYEEADHLIEENRDFWGLLNNFCQRSLEQRLENGALNLSRKEFDFDISDPKDIKITALDRNSAANRIIEELAISVNCETGRIFQEADFPGIYRTQSSYEIIKEITEGTKLSMENIRIEPARLSTIPGKHAGLGCDVYMQATSPIRRFVDLVTQQNLKLLINKQEPVFSEDDMMRWSEEISLRQRKYNRAEREIIKFWKLKYLKQHLGDNFEAKVRKKLANNNTEIELLELDCVVSAAGLTEFESGEQLLLRIDEVGLEAPKLVVKALSTGTDAVIHRLE
ncbi:MAG: RNB domain-containing ribonuclease [SAR324 cluster bacterium]